MSEIKLDTDVLNDGSPSSGYSSNNRYALEVKELDPEDGTKTITRRIHLLVDWADLENKPLLGNVSGPVSSTDNAITRFNGTTGKIIQDSSVLINDDGSIKLNGSNQSIDFGNNFTIKGDGNQGIINFENQPIFIFEKGLFGPAVAKSNTLVLGDINRYWKEGYINTIYLNTIYSSSAATNKQPITFNANNDFILPGKLVVKNNGSLSEENYNEGIRVLPANNGWSEIFFSNSATTSGTHSKGWIVGKRGSAGSTSGSAGDFTIESNGSTGTGLTLYADGSKPTWNGNRLAYESDVESSNLKSLKINGKTYDGSAEVDAGTIDVAYGGTGKTNAWDAANFFINSLTVGEDVPIDADYFVSQSVGGGTSYCRRPISKIWDYIKTKDGSGSGLNADLLDDYHAGVKNNNVAVYVDFPNYHTLEEIGYLAPGYADRGHPTEEYLQGICKWAIANYRNQEDITLIGQCVPNSTGTVLISLYSNDGYDSNTLLPRYCSGLYIALNGKNYNFGTHDYNWRYEQSNLNPTDYYWANVRISNTPSTATTPTFGDTTLNGTLTISNDIIYKGTYSSDSIIKFIDNTVDPYGNGIAIGGGGSTIIGGGESADEIRNNAIRGGGDEVMAIGSDGGIDFYSNCQNGFANAKKMTFDSDGTLNIPTSLNTAFVFNNSDMAENAGNLAATTNAHKITFYRNGLSIPYQMDNSDDGGILRCRGTSESNTIFELATWDDSGDGETIQFNYYPVTSQATPTYSVSVPKKSGTIALTSDIDDISNNYLPLDGGTLTGALGFKSNYLIKPVAEFRTQDQNYTGAITIILPTGIANTMVSMWIDVYNYVTNTSFSVHVGGYTYHPDSTWKYNPFGMVYGANHVIRLGHNGTNFVIYIGETTSTWKYPQISVRNVVLGYDPVYDNWKKDWTISFSTSFSNVTATINDYAWTTKNFNPSTSIPANGGQADYLRTFSADNTSHGNDYLLKARHNVDGNDKFKLQIVRTDGTVTHSTSVDYASEARILHGAYTGNGGQQNPNYFGRYRVGCLMMNTTVNGNSHYKDWLIMDSYNGDDVGGGVAIGVNRQSLGAYIMRSNADRASWAESAELIHSANIGSYVSGTANYIPKFTGDNSIGNGWQAKDITSASHCDWQSIEYASGQLITLNTLAYWNGAFNSYGNSNLKYCTRGEIASLNDIKNPDGYYWANIPISSTSSKTTNPTFSTVTATIVQAPGNESGNLGSSRYHWRYGFVNHLRTNSIIPMNTTSDSSNVNGVGSIGNSSYRWDTAYINTIHGDLDGNATSSTKSNKLAENIETDPSAEGGLTWLNINATSGASVNVNDGPTSSWWYILRNRHTNTSNNYYTDLAIPFNDNGIYYKVVRGDAVQNGGWVRVIDSLNIGSQSVSNADMVDNYHASSLWRSDGGEWNSGANITLNATGTGSEWSFDIYRNGKGGTLWHVWDSSLNTMLGVTPDNGHVIAPYGFEGGLTNYDGNIKLYPEHGDEINFGGTSTSSSIYFGYRSKDGRSVPTTYNFGSSSNSVSIKVTNVYPKVISSSIGSSSTRWYYMYAQNLNYISLVNGSDRRIKTNIEDFSTSVLPIINNIKIYDYQYKATIELNEKQQRKRKKAIEKLSTLPKTKDNKKVRKELNKIIHAKNNTDEIEIGLIAQELEKSLPKKYVKTFISKTDTNKNSGEYSVKTNSLIMLLWKAVQEQQGIINKQQQTLDNLTSRLEKLEKLLGE